MLNRLVGRSRKTPKSLATGITVYLLQDRIKRFSTEELNAAMQAAWHRPHDPTTFWATAIDTTGAVFKLNEAFYPLLYGERRLGSEELGELELPTDCDHTAFIQVSAKFPGGIPEDARPSICWLLGALVAQLAGNNTRALYFQEDALFVRLTPPVLERMKTPKPYLPSELRAIAK